MQLSSLRPKQEREKLALLAQNSLRLVIPPALSPELVLVVATTALLAWPLRAELLVLLSELPWEGRVQELELANSHQEPQRRVCCLAAHFLAWEESRLVWEP